MKILLKKIIKKKTEQKNQLINLGKEVDIKNRRNLKIDVLEKK